jgi:hypothetical protein
MRSTSEVNDTAFPFAEDTTAFILVYEGLGFGKGGRSFDPASTFDKKRELVERAMTCDKEGDEVHLLAVWPGQKRSDVFLIDDLDEALAAFG